MTVDRQVDLWEGQRLRDSGMASAEAGAGGWNELALDAVYLVCRRLATFTSDDVWASGLEAPEEARALGPVMMRARRAGYCAPTGEFVSCRRPKDHAMPIRVWRSLIYGATS